MCPMQNFLQVTPGVRSILHGVSAHDKVWRSVSANLFCRFATSLLQSFEDFILLGETVHDIAKYQT